MKVVRAEAMGFCFGVRDALDLARSVDEPEQTTVYGELVHNERVLDELDTRGFERMDELGRDALPESEDVLVTAHGISDRRRAMLESSGKRLIDTTCPLVNRAHQAAISLSESGYFVVVVGRRGHVEVQGIVEDLPRHRVIQSIDEAVFLDEKRIGIIFQTTTEVDCGEDIESALRAANPQADFRVEDTICAPTKDRQRALTNLVAIVDAVVVVGGRRSNNTLRLVVRSIEAGRPTFHVTSADELDIEALRRYALIGVTAGTSTPDEDIDAVCAAIEAASQEVPETSR